ncbi:MAG: hypothetical protein WBC71_02155, partial [Salaquimonas sp.]
HGVTNSFCQFLAEAVSEKYRLQVSQSAEPGIKNGNGMLPLGLLTLILETSTRNNITEARLIWQNSKQFGGKLNRVVGDWVIISSSNGNMLPANQAAERLLATSPR